MYNFLKIKKFKKSYVYIKPLFSLYQSDIYLLQKIWRIWESTEKNNPTKPASYFDVYCFFYFPLCTCLSHSYFSSELL